MISISSIDLIVHDDSCWCRSLEMAHDRTTDRNLLDSTWHHSSCDSLLSTGRTTTSSVEMERGSPRRTGNDNDNDTRGHSNCRHTTTIGTSLGPYHSPTYSTNMYTIGSVGRYVDPIFAIHNSIKNIIKNNNNIHSRSTRVLQYIDSSYSIKTITVLTLWNRCCNDIG